MSKLEDGIIDLYPYPATRGSQLLPSDLRTLHQSEALRELHIYGWGVIRKALDKNIQMAKLSNQLQLHP